jgi:pyridoxal phosphate enzyme (YggS family)
MKYNKKLVKFENELEKVCQKSGRKRNEIELVAITKNRSPAEINDLIENGIETIGENRLQEFLTKKAEIANCKKHFVGRIQSNKAREIAQEFDLIESVSSLKVAKILDSEAEKLRKILPIFLQVNLAREAQKDGFLEEDLKSTILEIQKLENIKVEGLMTIGLFLNENRTREIFEKGKSLVNKFGLAKLSAGMSGDWQIAVEAGATNLRIGRNLFTD